MPIFGESQVTNLRICGGNTILKAGLYKKRGRYAFKFIIQYSI